MDNASITTFCFKNSEDPPTNEVPSSAAAGAANQKVLDGVNNLQLGGATCKIEKDGGVDRHLNTTNTEILSLQDLHVKKLSLPDYICPSSEKKSRQAAVKEWIEKSSFPWALRTVPLLWWKSSPWNSLQQSTNIQACYQPYPERDSLLRRYRSGTVNSKSFVGKVLLRIKWKFELIYAL